MEQFRHDPARDRDYTVAAHWALYVENYLEGFHIPFVHAGLNDVVDYASYATELFRYASLQIALAAPGEPAFAPPPDSPDQGRRVAAYYWWLFPNLMLNFYPWGLSVNLVQPDGPDRTRVAFRSYVGDAALLAAGAGARARSRRAGRTRRSCTRSSAACARGSIAAAATRRRASAASTTSTGCSTEFL